MGRYHSPFALAMLDIDHFKLVNDRQGHLNGDRILQQLSQLLEECVRKTDVWRDTAAKSLSSSCRKPIWPARAC